MLAIQWVENNYRDQGKKLNKRKRKRINRQIKRALKGSLRISTHLYLYMFSVEKRKNNKIITKFSDGDRAEENQFDKWARP